ncbi:chitin deacetylase 8 [Aplysia californica]|uniref:Chitin deacetylase 8 n=1 Tax=Aplysia californica TaxID=6500 RepID=A0ABM1A9Z6_APLCA|nr:chitin deacetylase 8 [Aplysia californica]
MLTFDDAVLQKHYDEYLSPLLIKNKYGLKNPTGCQGRATFYVSLAHTQFDLVKILFNHGSEIGCHTIDHVKLPRANSSYAEKEITKQIAYFKNKMKQKTNHKKLVDEIHGFRAPYLHVAGDLQFDVLRKSGYVYDSSILNNRIWRNKQPIWPYTLDYPVSSKECWNPPCNTKPYPQFWEIPLNALRDARGSACSMLDDCLVRKDNKRNTAEDWFMLLKNNFYDYFYEYRIPMPLYTHAALFDRDSSAYDGLVLFLKYVLEKKNVWMIQQKQLIQYLRRPISNNQMKKEYFACHERDSSK